MGRRHPAHRHRRRGDSALRVPDRLRQQGLHSRHGVLLADAGKLDLDAPVTDVLPDFEVADAAATTTITPRHLLNHTSGIEGDYVNDTGRGDNCLARYIEGVGSVGLTNPPGATMSYSSTAYNVLGRIIEVVTGGTWDEALKELLCDPLGLEHTMTLPEEVLRFRAAMGHMGEPGETPVPTPLWNMLPRSAGPYGGICAPAPTWRGSPRPSWTAAPRRTCGRPEGHLRPLLWHLTPVSHTPAKTVCAGRRNEKDAWIPVVFYALADGTRYVHFGVRATAKAA
ncbi:serine hydrolase domain-containing protein [Streptomyces sp. NPDC056910]|uniref:serine hydrolase domain-containing protein n=1 Tax=Streptomyces sp. NPDC056910 TaxID=3345964 RepID=UPI00367FFF90